MSSITQTECQVKTGLCISHGFSVSAEVVCPSFIGKAEMWKEQYNESRRPIFANGLSEIEIVEAAKILRSELAETFPTTKFSVRVERFSMGESINVNWVDGASSIKVDAILHKYEYISRDAMGEILSGGNRYVQGQRTISEAIRAKETAEWLRTHTSENGYKVSDSYSSIWHKLSSTDY